MHVLALHAGISHDADVVSHTKVKQRARLATRFVDDEFMEGEVVRQDEILLQGHVHMEDAPVNTGRITPDNPTIAATARGGYVWACAQPSTIAF